ncbi:MAG: hypothetical protein COA78_26140 [Blastopirellula sp.]|nr:MAG: hypothetical protein COA78_26140 [Blastopirellula sp.]
MLKTRKPLANCYSLAFLLLSMTFVSCSNSNSTMLTEAAQAVPVIKDISEQLEQLVEQTLPVSTESIKTSEQLNPTDNLQTSKRTNPFSAPITVYQQQLKPRIQKQQMELVGIAGTHKKRIAIVRVNKEIVYMKENEVHHGVNVVSVNTSSVVLRKGKREWTLKLFE